MATQLERIIDSFFPVNFYADSTAQAERFTVPRCNFYEDADSYVVTAEMPGVKKEALDIKFDACVLTIEGSLAQHDKTPYSAEYRRTKFTRQLRVGDDIDVEAAKAELQDGVLTLSLPKAERAKARKISVL